MTNEERGDAGRRSDVMDAALRTFTRFGYRKTSMDDIANEARISRPGLYFLFASKSALFREAAERGVELDLLAAERALMAPDRSVTQRVVEAFDCWAGRYVGPVQDTMALIGDNPELLGPIARGAPERFDDLLRSALEMSALREAPVLARTLVSVSIGIKHQASDRDEYRARMTDAVRHLLPDR